MAILGIGIDIADISRVARIVSTHGDKFVRRIFTSAEAEFCAKFASEARAAEAFAVRFAAKEAFYKALPSDLQSLSSWKSIEILPAKNGRPEIRICDELLRSALLRRTSLNYEDTLLRSPLRIHLSVTHEKTHCAAVVIIETA